MSFAQLQTRLNAKAMRRFGDSVQLAGVPVQGTLDKPYERGNVGGMGMASAAPTFILPTSSVPPRVIDWFLYFEEPFDPIDLRIEVDGCAYLVVGHEPDAAGMSVLVLEAAP